MLLCHKETKLSFSCKGIVNLFFKKVQKNSLKFGFQAIIFFRLIGSRRSPVQSIAYDTDRLLLF